MEIKKIKKKNKIKKSRHHFSLVLFFFCFFLLSSPPYSSASSEMEENISVNCLVFDYYYFIFVFKAFRTVKRINRSRSR